MRRTAKSRLRVGRRSFGAAFLFLRSNRADGLSTSSAEIGGAAKDVLGKIVEAMPSVEMDASAFRRETL
jgi:hypothetical protein